MMKRLYTYPLLLLLLFCGMPATAQYLEQGIITYERKINVHRQIGEDDDNEWFERIKSQIPKFAVTNFDFYFTTQSSLYKPGISPEQSPLMKMMGGGPATENVVYTNYATNTVAANKQIFEQQFLVQDTVRRMRWKITDEIRTIANYKCRKAVGIMCDSVYVVAFYTEDILVSGGPEMFAGLPGMILEIAIPRLYTTWLATKVDVTPPKPTDIAAPEKGKKVTQQELEKTLQTSLKSWGKYAQKNIWWSML